MGNAGQPSGRALFRTGHPLPPLAKFVPDLIHQVQSLASDCATGSFFWGKCHQRGINLGK
jgi:hypothetical protein